MTVKATEGCFAGLEIHLWRLVADGKVQSFNQCLDTIDRLAVAEKALLKRVTGLVSVIDGRSQVELSVPRFS